MTTADLLLELMFSWIEQRELCAVQLRILAKELESLREKCNVSECLSSSMSVAGAACLIGAGAATFLTGGAAAPILGVLAAAYTGVGVTIAVATKITERFLSSSTMKEAQKIEKNNSEIAEKIQEGFKQLKADVRDVDDTDPDELDRRIMTRILRAMAQRGGLKGEINFSILVNELGSLSHTGKLLGASNPTVTGVGFEFLGILTFFTFSGSGKKIELLLARGSRELMTQMSSIGLRTVLRGGAMAVGGAVGLAFSLPEAINNWKGLIKENHVTEASQSLRDTADDLLKISRTLRDQFDNITQKLETLAEVKLCIENSNRSSEQKQRLIKFAKEHSEDEAVKEWLRENSKSEAFFKLVDMFCFLKNKLNEEKKNIDRSKDLHITFVAHGTIEASLIPASCLLPLPTITDVLLYSPWNCSIDAAAAYGVTTGRIRPQHRRFCCGPEKGFQIPDERHQPTDLPRRWNSMKKAGGQKIPNIFVSTLKKTEHDAWKKIEFLNDDRNRAIVPFILPEGMGSLLRVPFSVVTLALSLVLFFSKYKATVHLAACLRKNSKMTTLDEDQLKTQYACTIDHTVMVIPGEMFLDRDPELYSALKAVFG